VSDVWVVSAVLGWIVVALLVAVTLVLLRQVGELRARLDALDGGSVLEDEGDLWSPDPADLVGRVVAETTVPLVASSTADVDALHLAGPAARPTLLVYHSPSCWSCAGLEDAMTALRTELDDEIRIVSVLALRRDAAATHRAATPLPGVPTVSLDDLPDLLHADSTPSLRGVDATGRLAVVGRPSGLDDLRAAAARLRAG